MKYFLLCLLIITLSACSNKHERSTTADSATRDSIITIDSTRKTDFHTTYTDVIDNLFVFINKKEWRTAEGFYADTTGADFFKQYMENESIERFELTGISKSGDEVLVRTNAIDAKGTGREVCFLFLVNESNKVTSQRRGGCP
jgi:hypothetical protein